MFLVELGHGNFISMGFTCPGIDVGIKERTVKVQLIKNALIVRRNKDYMRVSIGLE
jgi:hypothetical protein